MDYLALRKGLQDSSLSTNLHDAEGRPRGPAAVAPYASSRVGGDQPAGAVDHFSHAGGKTFPKRESSPLKSLSAFSGEATASSTTTTTRNHESFMSSSTSKVYDVLPPLEPSSKALGSSPPAPPSFPLVPASSGARSKSSNGVDRGGGTSGGGDNFGGFEQSLSRPKTAFPRPSAGVATATTAGKKESRHFQSLQIFTSHAEPNLDEFLSRREQIEMENKHRDEEDKLYR